MSPPLSRVALITGSSRGIGAEIARALAADGMSVAVNFVRDTASAQSVVESIRSAGGTAEAFPGDVAIFDQCADLVGRVIEKFGALHTLVNNAGVYAGGSLEQMDRAHVERIMSVNIVGVLATTRAAAPHLARAATALHASGQHGSVSIINISSVAARAEWTGGSAYCASKAAVEALTRCHSAELGPKGIRVNAVAPGVTETDINRDGLTPEFRTKVCQTTALGRVGTTSDIAPLVAFLASPASRWITGQIIDADGGFKT